MNYTKLMGYSPTSYGTFKNSKGQIIEFYEHPLKGEDHPVICVCHSLELAETSDFWEADDMTEEHGDYEPWFDENKKLRCGELS